MGDWLRVVSQVSSLQAAVIGSRTYRAMSSSSVRCLLSAFRPCWGDHFCPVKDDGAHNTGVLGANRWTLPGVYTIIASVLGWNAVGDGVPFEDGKERGSSTDSHVGR